MVLKEDLKKRAIYIYLPSVEMADEWKELAEKAGVPISKFVIEHVENSLRQEDKAGYPSRVELIKQLREKNEELINSEKDNRLLRQLIDRLDIELKRYRTQPFLEQEFKGIRSFEKELIELLRKRKIIDSDHLLEELSIDTHELEIVKAINAQLKSLEAYGLIEATVRGWRWLE